MKVGKYKYDGILRPMLNVTLANGQCVMENDDLKVVDLRGEGFRFNETFRFDCKKGSEDTGKGGYSPLNDAFFFGTVVVKMYRDWINTEVLKNQVVLKVHYDIDFAGYTGEATVLGDGGATFYPLTSLDVIAHEVSHGYTEQNSGKLSLLGESFF